MTFLTVHVPQNFDGAGAVCAASFTHLFHAALAQLPVSPQLMEAESLGSPFGFITSVSLFL